MIHYNVPLFKLKNHVGTLKSSCLSKVFEHKNADCVFLIAGSFKGFRFTKDKYAKVSRQSPLFAIDCEMVCILPINIQFEECACLVYTLIHC